MYRSREGFSFFLANSHNRRDIAWALLIAHRVRREKLAGLVVVDFDLSERRVLYL